MDNRDFSNIGEQIRQTVEDAMHSMDYQQLNQKINQTVDMAMHEAKRQFQDYRQNSRTPHVKPPVQPKHEQHTESAVGRSMLRLKPRGKFSGILMTVLGASAGVTFLGSGLIALLGMLIGHTVITAFSVNVSALSFLCALVSLGVMGKGIADRRRYLNFKKYVDILDGREFCPVKELADQTNSSEKTVCRNLRSMIRKGMFVDGFLDRQGTCLIVTKKSYQQFCQAQEARRQREEEQAKAKEQPVCEENSAVDEMIRKGNEYIASIREANDAIPGEVISAKLDRLELVIRKIFESVRKHPEQMHEMDKFMEYYLPTTEKLVNAYREFDALPVKGENVTNSMHEIENTLDTISHAFEQLLDDLFQDAAFDISSDISVLQTMLAREGYKEKDFK